MGTEKATGALSRRKFIELGATGAATLCILPLLSGCGSENAQSTVADGAPRQGKATLAFKGGTVQTMVAEDDVAEAMAVEGNRIVYVGDEAGLEAFIGDGTTVIDLEGGMVAPGFMDGHIHAPGDWMSELYEIYLGHATTVEEYRKIIADFVEAHPEKDAYIGNPFMINAFELEDGSNPGPNKALLDEICPDKPILLRDVSYHSAWVNSKALELAGITAETPDPLGGIITKGADGEPTGYLIDAAATMVADLITVEHTDEEYHTAIAKYQEDAARYGLTGITNLPDVEPRFFSELEADGKLNLRMRILPVVEPGTSVADAVKAVRDLARFDSEMISTGTAKIFSDGVTEGGSAVMLEPYTEAAGKGSDWYGESIWDQQEFSDMVVALDKAGVQVHVHAIGDGAVHNTLDAYERAAKENGARDDRRNTITHVCAVTDEDVKRIADLDVICAMQFLWMYRDPLCELEIAYIGEERAMAMYPVKNMLEAGCFVSGASDGPVTGYAPLEEIEVAVTRNSPYPGEEDADMHRWPEQGITAYQALEAYTKNVAFENYMEDQVGTLEEGKKADLVVLDRNILECDPKEISDSTIRYTISDGRIVHEG
ncbi:amidohydrolase [Arabiibacter massiliensis]|uniref:amidohydrolase n=1 Tax=Arabiibacter massiliensis TaxID=1870985 RepID=UPI0009BBBF1E|nr:amidohydrolase [Arabiibacter massiliensis]